LADNPLGTTRRGETTSKIPFENPVLGSDIIPSLPERRHEKGRFIDEPGGFQAGVFPDWVGLVLKYGMKELLRTGQN
jgi:hypothetical protein